MKRQKVRAAILMLSFLLMSVTFVYLSPLFMITGLMQGIVSAALLFWIAAFILSFLFGRAFCGYLCPMGAEQELIDTAVRVPLRRVPHLRWVKYLAAALWIGGAVLLAAGAGSLAFNPLYGIGNGIPP
jgi:polyferredoxin